MSKQNEHLENKEELRVDFGSTSDLKDKFEYKMIEHNVFNGDITREMNSMGKKGWRVIRMFDPIRHFDTGVVFIRVFYERKQKGK